MKKLIAILFIPIFLLSTAGVAITAHYCKGKFVESGIGVKACCKDINNGGCCDTETKVVIVEDAYVKDAASVDVKSFFAVFIPQNFYIDFSAVSLSSSNKLPQANAPPLSVKDFVILFCSLLI